MTASDATGRLPAKGRVWRLGREVLVHLAIMAAVLGAAELTLRTVDLRELRESYEPGRALLFHHDTELGWAPIPNAASTFTGTRTVAVRNNSLGLRDVEPAGARKPPPPAVGRQPSGCVGSRHPRSLVVRRCRTPAPRSSHCDRA